MDCKDFAIKIGDNEIELPYLNSDYIWYNNNSKDYIDCKLELKYETKNGIRVSMNDIHCKLYKDGTVIGKKYGFTIKGNVKED